MTATLSLRRTLGVIAMALATLTVSALIATPVHAQTVDTEDTSSIEFTGQLIELSSTSTPTTIIVRENPEGTWTDYTVDVTDGTNTHGSMGDWVPGDSLRVEGTLNENTGVVTANEIKNHSHVNFRGLNGWITEIDTSASTMTVQWNNVEHVVNVTDRTRMVVPPVNPAALNDFEIEDRVRIRLFRDGTVDNEARIILALRRGPKIYNLARTRGFTATVNEIDGENDLMNVTITANPHLKDGDVNNLVGVEGDIVTVTWDDHTQFVRRYRGSTDEDEISSGDNLFIVGRVNDDGTVSARLIKDNSIFQAGVGHHVGEILSVDTAGNTVEVEGVRNEGVWTINYSDDTDFYLNREEADESALEVGKFLRARGTANSQQNTIDAVKIAVTDEEHPVLRRHEARIREIRDQAREHAARLKDRKAELVDHLRDRLEALRDRSSDDDDVDELVDDLEEELEDAESDIEDLEDELEDDN